MSVGVFFSAFFRSRRPVVHVEVLLPECFPLLQLLLYRDHTPFKIRAMDHLFSLSAESISHHLVYSFALMLYSFLGFLENPPRFRPIRFGRCFLRFILRQLWM